MTADMLVQDYLGRLEAAAWPLSADRRTELLAEIREHIEDALSVAGGRDETTVRNVLERLGRPEEIVSTEVEDGPPTSDRGAGPSVTSGSEAQPIGAVEIVALLLVSLGAFVLPVIGPLIGLVFVWASNRWTTRNKIIASVLVLLLAALPVLLLFAVRFGAQPMGIVP